MASTLRCWGWSGSGSTTRFSIWLGVRCRRCAWSAAINTSLDAESESPWFCRRVFPFPPPPPPPRSHTAATLRPARILSCARILTAVSETLPKLRAGLFASSTVWNTSLVSFSWAGEPVGINPFDDGGTSFVWGDEEAQHSLWPAASVFQPANGPGRVSGLHRTELD